MMLLFAVVARAVLVEVTGTEHVEDLFWDAVQRNSSKWDTDVSIMSHLPSSTDGRSVLCVLSDGRFVLGDQKVAPLLKCAPKTMFFDSGVFLVFLIGMFVLCCLVHVLRVVCDVVPRDDGEDGKLVGRELSILMMEAIEIGGVRDHKFNICDGFLTWIRERFDLDVVRVYIRENNKLVKSLVADQTGIWENGVPDEVSAMKDGDTVIIKVDGKVLIVKRKNHGGEEYTIVVGGQKSVASMPGSVEFINGIVIIVVSYWWRVGAKEKKEKVIEQYLSMIHDSHAFSVMEYRKGNMRHVAGTGPTYDIFDKGFMDRLQIKQRVKLRKAKGWLTTRLVPFSQVQYEVSKDGAKIWLLLTAQAHKEGPEKGDPLIYVLCEDISEAKRMADQTDDMMRDLELASRLLGLHKFMVGENGKLIFGEFDGQAGVDFDFDVKKDIRKLLHPDDVSKFTELEEMQTVTVRFENAREPENYQWFTMVCTSKDRVTKGLLFSVHELTELQSTLKSARACFEIGSATNAFAFWAVNCDQNEPPHTLFTTKQFPQLVELCHPDCAKKLDIDELRDLNHEMAVKIRLRLSSKIGYQWFSVTFIPSNQQQFLCLAFNIDEGQKMLDRLRETQQHVDMALMFSDVRMWTFEDTHKSSQAVLTWDSEVDMDMVMDWSTLEHNLVPEYQGKVIQAFTDALNGTTQLEIEVPFFFDNLHWLLLRGVRAEEESVKKLIGVYIDLTHIREASDQMEREKKSAEEASMAKSTFLANMSHEIRTLLNGIGGVLGSLRQSGLNAEQRELTAHVQASYVDLMELLNDTLDLAKFESRNVTPVMGRFDPCERIEAFQEEIFEVRTPPGVTFHLLEDPNEPVNYIGDKHWLTRITTNLVSNAAKFTHQGSIDVRFSCERDSRLVLEVTDTGIGMNEELIEGIREHLLHGETMVVYDDTYVGVGLSLVSEIVRLLKAEMTITSTVGVGSTFKVSFPFEPVDCAIQHKPKSPISVLVVGMDGAHAELTRRFGAFYGLDITCTDDIAAIESEGAKHRVVFVEGAQAIEAVERGVAKNLFKSTVVGVLTRALPASLVRRVEHFELPLKPNRVRLLFDGVIRGKIVPELYAEGVVVKEDKPPLHVLVADDEAMNHRTMKAVLTRLKATFVIVSDGQEAVDAIQKEHFDLVVLDQCMPILDGPSAARAIRAMPEPTGSVPIIGVTASIMPEDEEKGRSAGMNEFIVRPIKWRELGRLLEILVPR